MGWYDNPSADKFGPPPGSNDRFQQPRSTSPTTRLVNAGILLIGLRTLFDWYRGWAGHTSVRVGAGMIGLLVAELAVGRRRRRDRRDSPYSLDRHVTR